MLIRSGASSAGLYCLHQLCFIQVLFPHCDVDQGLIFFSSLVLAVGVIGNVLVILVLISYKSMRTSTNLFLLNLRCLLNATIDGKIQPTFLILNQHRRLVGSDRLLPKRNGGDVHEEGAFPIYLKS